MSGLQILFGFVLIGGGLLNIVARDWLWQLRVQANEMRGLQSVRTETWDQWRVILGIAAIAVGAIALVVSFVSRPPTKLVGEYTCAMDNVATGGGHLIIQDGGQGLFDGKPFTWQYNTSSAVVTISGDVGITSARFPDTTKPNTLYVSSADGGSHFCVFLR